MVPYANPVPNSQYPRSYYDEGPRSPLRASSRTPQSSTPTFIRTERQKGSPRILASPSSLSHTTSEEAGNSPLAHA